MIDMPHKSDNRGAQHQLVGLGFFRLFRGFDLDLDFMMPFRCILPLALEDETVKLANFRSNVTFQRLVDVGKNLQGHQVLDELERFESEVFGQILNDDRRLEMKDFFSGVLGGQIFLNHVVGRHLLGHTYYRHRLWIDCRNLRNDDRRPDFLQKWFESNPSRICDPFNFFYRLKQIDCLNGDFWSFNLFRGGRLGCGGLLRTRGRRSPPVFHGPVFVRFDFRFLCHISIVSGG